MVTIVAHPVTGEVITPSQNNPEWGTLRVDSVEYSFSNGIMNQSRRTAFIRGRVDALKSRNPKAGQKWPGRIQKQESFSPFYEGQSPKINPTTGEVILTNGRETFLQFMYVEDENALDIWIEESPEAVAEGAEESLAAQAI